MNRLEEYKQVLKRLKTLEETMNVFFKISVLSSWASKGIYETHIKVLRKQYHEVSIMICEVRNSISEL